MIDQWWSCYDAGLKGVITGTSFQHPAKYSWGLIRRIYVHAFEQGWVRKGDLVVDPMCGVAIGGLAAAIHDLPWVGIELEQRFVQMGCDNIALHAKAWQALGKPLPVIIQGDARNLLSLCEQARMVVSSPPYADGCRHTGGQDLHPEHIQGGQQGHVLTSYSDPSLMVSSPPYADSVNSQACGIDWTKMGPATGNRKRGPGTKNHETLQAQLSYQQPSVIISSPPYAGRGKVLGNHNGIDYTKCKTGGRQETPARKASGENYGTTTGQLGAMAPMTYWSEMHKIYAACYELLPVGGHVILVLKGFIRRGEYQDLPAQTAQLLEHIGFTVIHWHKAILTSPVGQLTLDGDVEVKSRKSFFRRLHEKKHPHLAIDNEVVICAEKRV